MGFTGMAVKYKKKWNKQKYNYFSHFNNPWHMSKSDLMSGSVSTSISAFANIETLVAIPVSPASVHMLAVNSDMIAIPEILINIGIYL